MNKCKLIQKSNPKDKNKLYSVAIGNDAQGRDNGPCTYQKHHNRPYQDRIPVTVAGQMCHKHL